MNVDWITHIDWILFWSATTAAATLATAISTSIVLWLRRRDRPEPDWAIDCQSGRDSYHLNGTYHSDPYLVGKLVNAGDGVAFRITVEGNGCDAYLCIPDVRPVQRVPFLAVTQPGDAIGMFAKAPTEEEWTHAHVTIAWTRPPTRLRKRVRIKYRLTDLAQYPMEKEPANEYT